MEKAIVEFLTQQLVALQDVWPTFLAALIAAFVFAWLIIWKVIERLHKPKDDLIKLYEARLKGMTPDEAAAKIQTLEETRKRTVGSPWRPLSYGEVQALARELRAIEKRRVQVMYENFQGRELARTIADAFEAAGWEETHYSTGSGFEEGLKVGRSPTLGPLIKGAIERTTALKPIYEPPNKGWPADSPMVSIYVGVGINPD